MAEHGCATEGHRVIRPTTAADLVLLADIERAAGTAFGEIGMALIAADDPLSLEELRGYHSSGRAWVATDERDRPIAYVLVDDVDGCTHVAQVSVHPDHARRGVGRRLLEHVVAWTAARGATAVTLTTFLEVPWNAPYYARCGFRMLTEGELTPGLRSIRKQEGIRGMDRWPRCCMRRDV